MESESGVTRRIMDELHFSDIQGDQMEGGRGMDELHFSDIQGDQMEGGRGVTRSILNKLHC